MSILKSIIEQVKKEKTTFNDISNLWLQNKRKIVKESSYANYKYFIKKYLTPQLGNMNLKKIEKYDFNNFVDGTLEELSTKTVKDIICILKSILYLANEKYDCKVKVRNIIIPKIDTEPLIILSQKERNKLEKYCIVNNTLKNLGILICLNTGLRIGEICALKWKYIDLDKKEIHIRKTLQRVYDEENNKTKIIIDKPKTSTSIRNIPISTKLYDLLKPLKGKYKEDSFFLTGETEKYIEPRNYRYIFRSVLKINKLKKYKFHILRHTFANNCIEVGMDIKSLSEILGHASVEITLNRYVHSSYKTKKKYLEKL